MKTCLRLSRALFRELETCLFHSTRGCTVDIFAKIRFTFHTSCFNFNNFNLVDKSVSRELSSLTSPCFCVVMECYSYYERLRMKFAHNYDQRKLTTRLRRSIINS